MKSPYEIILFDLDGVITSEQCYWDCAALTVYEQLTSSDYFGDSTIDVAAMSRDVRKIRDELFDRDKFIKLCKNVGVNSNWDLSYVFICATLLTGDRRKAYDYIESQHCDALELYERLGHALAGTLGKDGAYTARGGTLWHSIVDCFQEWYLGDTHFATQYGRSPVRTGKDGIMGAEQPLIPLPQLRELLEKLSRSHTLGIGTGRVDFEVYQPFERLDLLQYFDPKRVVSFTYVLNAEKAYNASVSKPHPYMFVKGALGVDYPDDKIIGGDYPRDGFDKVLVVGDAFADMGAALAAGMDFCAVLTGVAGDAARPFFEQGGAKYILPDVTHIAHIVDLWN